MSIHENRIVATPRNQTGHRLKEAAQINLSQCQEVARILKIISALDNINNNYGRMFYPRGDLYCFNGTYHLPESDPSTMVEVSSRSIEWKCEPEHLNLPEGYWPADKRQRRGLGTYKTLGIDIYRVTNSPITDPFIMKAKTGLVTRRYQKFKDGLPLIEQGRECKADARSIEVIKPILYTDLLMLAAAIFTTNDFTPERIYKIRNGEFSRSTTDLYEYMMFQEDVFRELPSKGRLFILPRPNT